MFRFRRFERTTTISPSSIPGSVGWSEVSTTTLFFHLQINNLRIESRKFSMNVFAEIVKKV